MKLSMIASALGLALSSTTVIAVEPDVSALVNDRLDHITQMRRDFHQYPELSNREVKTAAKVAVELKKLGYTVQTGIAHTGVVGILDSGKPGPKLAIRADMDALPVA